MSSRLEVSIGGTAQINQKVTRKLLDDD